MSLLFHFGQVIVGIDADPSAFQVGQNLTKWSHVHPVVVAQILSTQPGHLLQLLVEHVSNEPRPLGIVARVLDPLGSMQRVPLHRFDGRQIDQKPVRSIAPLSFDSKNLLHGLLATAQQVARQGFQTVAAATAPHYFVARGILQARHVHRIPTKAADVDSLVVHDVSIKAVIVPDFEEAVVLEPRFELLEDTARVVQIVDPQCGSRAVPEAVVKVGARVDADASDVAVADGSHLF